MTRAEIFMQVYPNQPDNSTRLFEQEYRVLHNLWETIPPEYLESLLDLPKEIETSDRGPDCHDDNARKVSQHYRYRMASEFSNDLPDIFRRVMMLSDDIEMMDLLFFGTMGALSACLPNVNGSLFKEDISPNLYFFITGPAASGKGKIGLCRRLLDPLNEAFTNSEFILPANSSDTAFYEELFWNGGRGIIFESEADTLTAAFHRASGKFSDGLRAAFHNEPITYLRRTNNERVVIQHPVLSMVLTGTPGQVRLLLNSPENGLFSRILFYRLMNERESFVDEPIQHRGITGKMVNDYMTQLGKEVRDFYFRLDAKEEGIQFRLTEEQHQAFMDHFHEAAIQYKELFRQGYESDEAADHADSIMKRLGNICYRMMMVLSVSRLMSAEGDLPDEVVCDQRDFDRVMGMEPVLRYHNHLHYDELMVATGRIAPLGEEDESIEEESDDLLSDTQRKLYTRLPDQFTTQQAVQIAKELKLSPRSTNRYLLLYCELGIMRLVRRGNYEKVRFGNNPQPVIKEGE